MSERMKWLLLGLATCLFGLMVLANTYIATIAIATMTGLMLLAAGVFQAVGALTGAASVASRLLAGLMGLILGFLGISFLFNPLGGAVSLTTLAMVLLAAGGAVRILFAWRLRTSAIFWPLILSGAFSVLLAGYIWANFAAATMSLLGTLLGVELLLNGLGLLLFAITLRDNKNRPA
jgi:uncharacterized membrane protein HdeD (DUF308 family)